MKKKIASCSDISGSIANGILILLGLWFFVGSSAMYCALPQPTAWTFAVYGDCRSNHKVHAKVVEMMAAARPAVVLNTGDLVEHGKRADEWNTFFQIIAPLLNANIPYYPTLGNHDEGGEKMWETRFDIPSGSGSKLYYSFDRFNAHFIALNTEESFKPDSPQGQWLEKDLAATAAQHVFVFGHRPPHSIGLHGSDRRVRREVCPLLEKHKSKVRVAFWGHDHLYYRTQRNNVFHVVTGGGGAPLYPILGKSQPGDVRFRDHHFLLVTVNGNEVKVKAYDLDGKKRDQFAVASG